MVIQRGLVIGVMLCSCYGQVRTDPNTDVDDGLSKKIGNFSIELLNFAASLDADENTFISTISVWSELAMIAEGASGSTLKQISTALRNVPATRHKTRASLKNILQRFQANTTTVVLERFNAMFVDEKHQPLKDFVEVAGEYNIKIETANFSDQTLAVNTINNAVQSSTHGRISSTISSEDLVNSPMVLTSALYFKGLWTSPFNASMTLKAPFYSSTGEKIGEVNMMHQSHNYPYAVLKSLQAWMVEIPYGTDDGLSMVILLPNRGVSLKDMFSSFNNVSLDSVFNEFKQLNDEFPDEIVNLLLPRFKIESKLDLTDVLKAVGIRDLFDERNVRLPLVSPLSLHVGTVIHKSEIEVTEEGIPLPMTFADFTNRMDSSIRFNVNRPFCYLIIEKKTNTIVFAGIYTKPTLY